MVGSTVDDKDAGVVAKAVNGDTVVDYSPGAGQRLHHLRFAFLLYDRMVETQLTQAVIATDTIIHVPIQHAPDVTPDDYPASPTIVRGDVVRIADEVEFNVLATADDSANGVTAITLDAAVGKAYATGTKVVIRTIANNHWSDSNDGVTELVVAPGATAAGTAQTITVRDARNLSKGMVVRVESTAGIEEMRVLYIEDPLGNDDVRVVRGINGTVGVNHPVGSAVKCYWAPIQNTDWSADTFFPIGGTGISVRVDLDPNEMPFIPGDTIEIVAPGLTLEQQAMAKVVSFNNDSILRYQNNIPWSIARDTRFLAFRPAVEVAKRMVRDLGFGKKAVSGKGPLRLIPVLGDPCFLTNTRGVLRQPTDPVTGATITAASPNGDNPPVAPDTAKKIAAYIRGFSVNPISDRVTVDFKAVNKHAW
jgi:hypothetical protein